MPNEQNRVTIAGTAYHQLIGQNPFSVPLRGSMPLTSEEQVYSRTPPKGIGEAWELLDTGWLRGRCSIIYIRNEEPIGGPRIEIGKEGTEIGGLSIFPVPLCVPPGMVGVFYPIGSLAIRCEAGGSAARYTVYAIPE